MSEPNAVSEASRPGVIPPSIAIPLAIVLITIFIALLFPWDAVARRVAWEIGAASGARVTIERLAPALSARGPVLRASDVVIEHPAVERVRLNELEIAPRFSASWLHGEPTLRIWADSELGLIDGVLRLGESPAYTGRVSGVELARLPLRLDASAVRFSGELNADADVALDANGTLAGRVQFESPSLQIQSDQLPLPLAFSHAEGVIELLETGATRIESVKLEGDIVQGEIDGEIGLVHRSQSPPIELTAQIEVVDSTLRQLAPAAGLQLSADGRITVQVRGTLDEPILTPTSTRRAAVRRGRSRVQAER